MTNLITNNAYRVLGLDGSADQKDILKRSKEIINRLKIDDCPEYSLDVNLTDKFRTEESVSDALKRLQNIKDNLNEYFFWFNITDAVDEDAFEHLQYTDATSFDKAIQIWKDASNTDNSAGLLYKKNLALLYCLALLNEENDDYLNESLSLWNEIINSDKFWTAFEKSYAISNDQASNSNMISNFKKNVVKHISDVYHDLYLRYENKKYIRSFQNIFETLGKKTEESLLKPIHESIYDTIKKLEKINLENIDDNKDTETNNMCDYCGKPIVPKMYKKYDDGSVLCNVCSKEIGKEWKKRIKEEKTVEGSTQTVLQIQRTITKLESQLAELNEIGLYDDVQSKVVRDHAAEAVRRAAIMIHNDAHMKSKSAELASLAKKIAGTESVKERLQSDLESIEKYMEEEKKDTLTYNMGGFLRKKELVVRSDYIQYKKKIFYKDILAIAYYGIDDGYFISIISHKDKMKIPFGNSKNSHGVLNEVLTRINPIIEPIIVSRLVRSIFEDDRIISIGKVDFDRQGYHTRRFRRKSVLWEVDLFPPQVASGKVYLFENKNNERKKFASVPVTDHNAVMIPSLVDACFKEHHMRNQQ